PQSVADLAKELLEKEKTAGFKFLDFFKLFKGVQPDSSNNEISKAFEEFKKTLDFENTIQPLLNSMLNVSDHTDLDLFTNLNNISTFKDSHFSKIPQVVSFLERIYTIYFQTLVQALSTKNPSSDQAAGILTRFFAFNLNSELYKNLDKIIKFTDKDGKSIAPSHLLLS
ncbi:hypothetical protein, partial [Mesomycoplasma ovipneumoniae]|uniref:hypothetical protein n=1 Tax=Mesomycoplasma ovipneumoniae TaxID=29562 RepID=UPI00307FEC40